MSRSHSNENITVAWLLLHVAVVLLLPAWNCTSYDCLSYWFLQGLESTCTSLMSSIEHNAL